MKSLIFVVVLLAGCVCPALAQPEPQSAAKPGGDVSAPVLIEEVKPEYPPAALNAGISGNVRLECVVNADGTVGEVRVVEPLDPTLDQEAVTALKQWRFKPGTKDGKPVPVRVDVEMSFSQRPRGPKLDSPDVYKVGGDVTAPRVLKEVKPLYIVAKAVQGAVVVECVVLPDGTVGDARIVERLHPQLDAEALKAVRRWSFEPGMKDGKAVPVQVEITMTFTFR